MGKILEHLKYAQTHEWVKLEDDRIIRIGITDFAQDELGDLVYIELPEVGRKLAAKEQCAVVESVKTASDLYSPVAGEIVEVNAAAKDDPALVNEDSYANWLFSLRADNIADLEDLLDATGYKNLTEE